jgi:hypothetical protein
MKLEPVKFTKPKSLLKSPKSIGQLTMWGCGGMAYFNFFSTLNLSPGLQFGLSGVVPMAALIGYLLLKPGAGRSADSETSANWPDDYP